MVRFGFRQKKPSVITLADRARDAREWDLAGRLYRTAIQRNPGNPALWVQYGHVLKEAGDLAQAEYAYRTAVAQNPSAVDSHAIQQSLGQIHSRLSRLEAPSPVAFAVYVGNERLITRVALNNFDLIFFVEADDRLIVPHLVTTGIWEPEVTNFFLKNIEETSHCLDVGANFGYYSLLMGKCAHSGRTIALEPDSKIFELLRDNIFVNDAQDSMRPVHAAAAAESGQLTLYRRVTRSGNTSIILLPEEYTTCLGEKRVEPFTVDAIRVDALLPDLDGRIDFIKVDVEGAEPLVFRGACETIARNPHLRIVMEWSPDQIQAAGFDPGDFTRALAAMGLRPAILGQSKPEPATWNTILGARYLHGVLLTVGD